MADNIDEYGGNVGYHSVFHDAIIRADGKDPNDSFPLAEETKFQQRAKDKDLTAAFLLGSSDEIAQQVVADLKHAYVLDKDTFPTSVTGAYNLLVHYRGHHHAHNPAPCQGVRNMSFLQDGSGGRPISQDGTPVAGTDGVLQASIVCFRCNHAHC